jgi:hypothetical protein
MSKKGCAHKVPGEPGPPRTTASLDLPRPSDRPGKCSQLPGPEDTGEESARPFSDEVRMQVAS